MVIITAAPFFMLLAGEKSTTEPYETSYVVIGAFTYHTNAIRFTAYARQQSLDAKYAINTRRDMYYVYVFSSQSVEAAVREAQRIRSQSDFPDAWVYTGRLGDITNEKQVTTQTKVLAYNAQSEEKNRALDIERETLSEKFPVKAEHEIEIEEEEPVAEKKESIDKEEGYYNLFFNTVSLSNYQEIKGRVRVIDPERVKHLSIEKTHELVKLKDPNNGTRRVKLSTDIFGFKEVQYIIDLDQPLNDSTESFVDVQGDSIIVNFEMRRFKKGDVIVMYNVYFYIDAAIMKPESLYDLNSLLDMIKENDKLKLRIHGHTNGNSHGKIIHLNTEDKNFFSLNADHKETVGSAKKLSHYRAYTIQQWLKGQGISEKRMDIKGWGGKKMLYDEHDLQAHKNVRVEVEIVEN